VEIALKLPGGSSEFQCTLYEPLTSPFPLFRASLPFSLTGADRNFECMDQSIINHLSPINPSIHPSIRDLAGGIVPERSRSKVLSTKVSNPTLN
jgi:hypothetical protein